ncbi:MAG: glycoside hydrolase [Ignavibacteriae bacterium]|nr:glycoside hydrolase [Ignavibacteriota bacterium]
MTGRVITYLTFILLAWTSTGLAAGASYDVRDFGARGDGVTNDRAAIQRAVDSCGRTGGTVAFPPGRYLTGSIDLVSNVELRLEHGAVILGSTRIDDYVAHTPAQASYNDLFLRYSLFYAEGKTNIAISGSGTIDGQGGAFTVTTRAKPARYMNRPYVLRFVGCKDVTVTGVTLQNSAMWMQHYFACEGVVIRGIRVWNHANQNNDMMDIDGCRNVIIADCIGDTEDDAITLKSTSPHVTENVTITNCVVSSHCNAIKTGTESTGGFRNITITNIVVKPSANTKAIVGHPAGISGITLATVDGGVLERVSVSDCVIDGPKVPIFIRLGARGRKYAADAPAPGVGTVRDIVVRNITATAGGPIGCSVSGIPGHRVTSVHLSNIVIGFPGGGTLADAKRMPEEAVDQYPEGTHWGALPAYGLYIRHAEEVVVDNVVFTRQGSDARPALVVADASNITVGRFRAQGDPTAASLIRCQSASDVLIQGSSATSDVPVFLEADERCDRILLLANDLRRAARPVHPTGCSSVRLEGNASHDGK